MAKYDIVGVIEKIGATEAIGSNGFTKRELILGNDIDDPSKYPNPKKFVFKKDKCAMLDDFRIGQRVALQFAIDGREWNGKYFVDLTGLFIAHHGEVSERDAGKRGGKKVPEPVNPEAVDYGEVADDMPF